MIVGIAGILFILPISQRDPEYPVLQEHEPTPLLVVHVPPLRQKIAAHEGPVMRMAKD